MVHLEESFVEVEVSNSPEPCTSPKLLDVTGYLRFGYGVKRYPDGSVYSGNFLNGERSGFGTCCKPTGERYEGEWKNDFRHGKGIENYGNNTTYKGNFVNGRKQGLGVYSNHEGFCYEGRWKSGKPHGRGKATFPDGTTYQGELVDGKRHGVGVLTKPNGYMYKGEFQDGLPHGKGVERFPDGFVFEGVFCNGNRMAPLDTSAGWESADAQVSHGRLRSDGNDLCALREHGFTHIGKRIEGAGSPISAAGRSKNASVAFSSPHEKPASSLHHSPPHHSIPSKMVTVSPMLRSGGKSSMSHNDSLQRVCTARKNVNFVN